MSDTLADDPPLDKKARRVLKKLRKQLARGDGPNRATQHLVHSAEGAPLMLSAVSGVSLDAHLAGAGVTVRDTQGTLLWLAGQAREPRRRWLTVRNPPVVGCIAVLLLRGLTWDEWARATGRPTQPTAAPREGNAGGGADPAGAGAEAEIVPPASAFPEEEAQAEDCDADAAAAAAAAARAAGVNASLSADSTLSFLSRVPSACLRHRKGGVWNAFARSVVSLDERFMHLPRGASLEGESESEEEGSEEEGGGRGGGARGGGHLARGAMGAGHKRPRDDGTPRVPFDSLSCARDMCLRLGELESLGFPMLLNKELRGGGAGGQQGIEFEGGGCDAAGVEGGVVKAPSSSTLPPGRVAGASNDSSTPPCTLAHCIPRGHIITRTAHVALHAAFPSFEGDWGLRCPLLPPISPTPPTAGPSSHAVGGAGALATAPPAGGGEVGRGSHDPAAAAAPLLLGIDCEMCAIRGGSALQLARVTVVGVGSKEGGGAGGGQEAAAVVATAADAPISDTASTCRVLYDTIVIPEVPVTDHLTQFSGITPAMLSSATTSMAAAQDAVADLLDGIQGGGCGCVAVGHSLESDLTALRLIHTRCMDTSLLYQHPAGLPVRFALRVLAQRHLGRVIQAGHVSRRAGAAAAATVSPLIGHDSAEDASAALDLVLHLLAEEEGAWMERSSRGGPPQPSATTAPPVDEDTAAIAELLKPSRPHRVLPTNGGGGATTDGVRGGGRGIADTLEQLRSSAGGAAGAGAAPSFAATVPSASPREPGGRLRLLLLPDMNNTDKVLFTTLIGSPTFLNAHVGGTAAHGVTISTAGATAAELRRVTDAMCKEALKASAMRERRRTMGVGLVIAEARVPRLSAAAAAAAAGAGSGAGVAPSRTPPPPDLVTLDQVCAGLANTLPRNTLLVVLTQADAPLRFAVPTAPGGARGAKQPTRRLGPDALLAATSARSGCAFFHVSGTPIV